MKSQYTLDEAAQFFKYLGKPQVLTALYILNKFDGAYISDIAQAMDVSLNRMVGLFVTLKKLGIVNKKSVPRAEGRMVFVTIDEDVNKVLSPVLMALSKDPEIMRQSDQYQYLKDSKKLVSDKYGI